MDNYSIYVIPVIYTDYPHHVYLCILWTLAYRYILNLILTYIFTDISPGKVFPFFSHLYFHRYFTWQGFPFYQMRSFSRHHHLSMASRTIEQRRTILLSNLGFVCFIGKRKNNTTNTKRQMKKGDGNFIAYIFTYFLLIVITVIWDFLLCIFFHYFWVIIIITMIIAIIALILIIIIITMISVTQWSAFGGAKAKARAAINQLANFYQSVILHC